MCWVVFTQHDGLETHEAVASLAKRRKWGSFSGKEVI